MLKITEYCGEFEISIPTFRRYVATLREFFWGGIVWTLCTTHPEKGIDCLRKYKNFFTVKRRLSIFDTLRCYN